jgi:tetratricopeptide (TPR) repeat protein
MESIDRLLERGDLHAANTAAQRLLERCLAAGDTAYQGATYDIATAYWSLGRTQRSLGAAEAALQLLTEAQQRFQALAEAGSTSASRMAYAALTERGNCLMILGRFDEAATAFENTIQHAAQRNDRRRIALNKVQLGTVRMLQQRYKEALAAYQEALKLFDILGEPGSMATLWHQIGIVYRYERQFEQAEQAYRQSLAIEVQQQNRSGEAISLEELGVLYNDMGRLEEVAAFYRQAADIYVTLHDLMREGHTRSNLAATLITLQRYDDARQELQRALECAKPFGHAAQSWNTWALLHDLEQATDNAPAATDAWQQAVQCYLAYRRAGGESQEPGARLCARIACDIRQGDTTEVTQFLAQAAAAADTPARLKAMLPKLQAILHGDRDPALAADPALDYRNAAELLLLLETLGGK